MGCKILIVEDEVVIALDLRSTLEDKGYIITDHITRGEDAIKSIHKSQPDLVLMDIKLEGDLNGVETAKMIRDYYDIPVIFLTSYSNSQIIDSAKEANPYGYIIKPYQEIELVTNIELTLHKHLTELRIKESERKYRELAESIQQIIFECDTAGKLIYLNEPGMQILGIHSSNLRKGVYITDFFLKNDWNSLVERLNRNDALPGKGVKHEYKLTTNKGKVLCIEESVSLVIDKGVLKGFRGLIFDISAKKVKENLNYLLEKINLKYSGSNSDFIAILKEVLAALGRIFPNTDEIYFNLFDDENDQIIKYGIKEESKRKTGFSHSEYVRASNMALYLQGDELRAFNEANQIKIFGTEATMWVGFPLRLVESVFGVLAFQSFRHSEILSKQDFDSLLYFFDSLQAYIDRVSYMNKLRKSQTEYMNLVNSISEGIVKLDRSYRIRFVNKRLCELLSCCDLDLMDKNIFDAFEFDSESKKDIEKNVLTDRKKLQSSFQVRVKTRNGLMKTMLVSIVLMKEPYNPENRFLCTIKDITERQELVQLFNESETRFKTIFDQSSLGILILSSEHGLITDVNPTAKKILGWTKKELVGNSLLDICHPIYQPVVKEMWDQYIRAGENELFIETKLQHKENKSIWGGITIGEFIQDNSKDGPSYIAYIRDISERKKMEQKLKAKDIEKENILKAIPESFLVIDKNGIVNRSYLKSTELFPKYDIVDGKMYTEVFEKQVINQVTKNIIKCIKNGETISEVLEYDKNERQYYYDFRYIKLKGANVLITISDITNVKTSVRQLQQYFNIIEQAKELILITDSTGKIEYVNPTFTEVTGYTMEELKGRNPSVLKSGKHTKSFYSDLWQSIITNNSIRTEIINKKKTGETYIEEKIITSIRNEEGKITNFISTGRDVTEIRKKERKIQIYQRFEKILQKREQKTRTLSLIKGQENERKRLARELHDSLGQMLTITKANLYNLKLEKILDPQEKEKIALAQELISEIIQESRIISYNLSPGALYEFGLNKVLSQMVQSINSNIKGTRILYEENLGETRFNSEVEINLYRIIQEAIQNSIKHSRAKTIRLSINQKKGILSVIVEDDGKGMETDALIAKRFSGGLNNIEERSRAIDGKVVFNTQPGQGFRISLTLKTKPILV